MPQSKTKIINLFGAAGAGKSTQAMGLVTALRLAGYSTEYVAEYAKDVVYEKHLGKLEDQLYIFAKQNRRIQRVLSSNFDFIVTDSPLFLSYFYGTKYSTLIPGLETVIFNCINRHENINIFLHRNHPYQEEGRVQSEVETEEDSNLMEDMLSDSFPDVPLYSYTTDGTPSTIDAIFELIKNNYT